MYKKLQQQLDGLSINIFYGLLAYMPFHIFISTVIGANIGGLAVLKVLKDIVLMFGFCSILVISVRKGWFKKWLTNKLLVVILAYAALTVLLALVRPTDPDAEILGIVYNLRFLVFFLYGWLLVKNFPDRPILQTSLQIATIAGVIVALLGVLQYVVLPNDALTHLGFTRANGVFPAFFIDDKPDLERVMSTLRDPNSLGSYLIIILGLLYVRYKTAEQKARAMWMGAGLLTLLCLVLTFSRSAIIGLWVACLVWSVIAGKNKLKLNRKQLRLLSVGLVALVVLAGTALYIARDSYLVQNVVFHADQSTVLEDPNQLRIRFAKQSAEKIVHNPLGLGPGRAGLASIRNNVQGTQLNENYYLQIGTEVGLLGLLLLVAILALTARQLYLARTNTHAIALLAVFAGLAVTNVLVHIWSNEAVAYTWWGLAGLVIASEQKHFTTPRKPRRSV